MSVNTIIYAARVDNFAAVQTLTLAPSSPVIQSPSLE